MSELTGEKLVKDTKFKPGEEWTGNANGRPVGSISAITKVKQIFEDDPNKFQDFIDEYIKDPTNRKHIVEMIDGKPRQPVDMDLKGNVTVQIVKYDNDNTPV